MPDIAPHVAPDIAPHIAIADRLAITDLLYRYCRAMDRIDHELGYAVWHENAEADYGPMFRGTGRGFIDWVLATHARMIAHSHQITNILVELDGSLAASEAYVTVALRYAVDGRLRQMTGRGRYLDRLEKRDGRWGIVQRRYIHDFDSEEPVTNARFAGWGRRDRDDPSYAVLALNAGPA